MIDTTEIQLHLLRHAHAGDPYKWSGSDDERPLSEKGRAQAERLGRFLAAAGFRPDAILTSPKVRAAQTARLVGTALALPVTEADKLAGPLDALVLEGILSACGNPRRPLMVGHDPDFSDLAAALSGVGELPMRKGSLVRIDIVRPLSDGVGILRWLLPPELFSDGV